MKKIFEIEWEGMEIGEQELSSALMTLSEVRCNCRNIIVREINQEETSHTHLTMGDDPKCKTCGEIVKPKRKKIEKLVYDSENDDEAFWQIKDKLDEIIDYLMGE